MAKSAVIKIKLISEEKTGIFYVTRKNTQNSPDKMRLKKYDPVINKHCYFKEAKIK